MRQTWVRMELDRDHDWQDFTVHQIDVWLWVAQVTTWVVVVLGNFAFEGALHGDFWDRGACVEAGLPDTEDGDRLVLAASVQMHVLYAE